MAKVKRIKQLSDIVLANRDLVLFGQSDIDNIEQTLGARLQTDYVEFVKRFGTGSFCAVLRIHEPKVLIKRAADQKSDQLKRLLGIFSNAKEITANGIDAADLFEIATSIDGDSIYASKKSGYLVVPRHRNTLSLCKTFAQALDWFWSSGEYWSPAPCPWFCSSLHRNNAELTFDEDEIDDVTGKFFERLTKSTPQTARWYEGKSFCPELLLFEDTESWVQVFSDKLAIEYSDSTNGPIEWLQEVFRDSGIKCKIKKRKGPRW